MKQTDWYCGHWFGDWTYTIRMKHQYCQKAQITSFDDAPMEASSHRTINPADLTEGSPAHTVHKYCKAGNKPGSEAKSEEELEEDSKVIEDEEQETQAEKDFENQRDAIISQLVHELSDNSIDTMAKELRMWNLANVWKIYMFKLEIPEMLWEEEDFFHLYLNII